MIHAVTQFHENPRIIAWVQRPAGRLALWLVASALLVPSGAFSMVPLFLGLAILWPEKRLPILLLAAPLIALKRVAGQLRRHGDASQGWDIYISALPSAFVVLMFFVLCYLAAKNFHSLPAWVRRHPLLTLHALAWCVILACWRFPPEGVDSLSWRLVTPISRVESTGWVPHPMPFSHLTTKSGLIRCRSNRFHWQERR